MDLTAQIDAYCERLTPDFWGEPLNAVTNVAFLIAALVMAWRIRGDRLPVAWALVVTLVVIGLSSGAWHTWALAWMGAADSLSILIFVLIYFWAANRHYWAMSPLWSTLVMLGFLPYAIAMGWVIGHLPFLRISGEYWAIALLIAGYAWTLRHRAPDTARNLGIGAAILAVSITARSLDTPMCGAWPVGTHFLWHCLNAVMLGWMIETYRRHRLQETPPRA